MFFNLRLKLRKAERWRASRHENRTNWCLARFRMLASALLLLAAIAWQTHGTNVRGQSAPDAMRRTQIADGEYTVYQQGNEGAVGPYGEEVYDFHEKWTLWKHSDGQYEVEGERQFESPRDKRQTHRFITRLSRDLTVLQVTEFAPLNWVQDSSPLTCKFLTQELYCSAAVKDPRNAVEQHIPVSTPYGVLWPISPFSLGSLAKEEERDLTRSDPASLVSIQQPSPDNPVEVLVFQGDIQYLGVEDLETAGQHWPAYKFLLKVPLHPKLLMWTSRNGLLLGISVERSYPDWPVEGIRLTRFVKWHEF
jgi:hypothetical protein